MEKIKTMSRLKKQTKNSRGFTMLEVIVVLVVLGILVAVAASRFTSPGNELYTESDLLKSNLRFAQLKALTNNDDAATTWGISFAGGTYTLQRNGSNSAINFPADNSATHNLSGGVIVTAPAGITYDFWGSPGPADILVTLNQDGQSISFTITQKTGFIP